MLLEVKNLSKHYNGRTVLRSFSASFSPGVYAIIGNNGAGKSTLMNLLTDNLKRSGGNVYFNGKEILDLGATYRGRIGYMPQEFSGYMTFSIWHFLSYMALMKGVPKKLVRQQINDVLKIVNLEREKNKKINQLSGGMRQRVMLAQALLGEPSILFLDEPTAGLDPKERLAVKEFVKSISEGKIIFVSTHIISDIENLVDEIVLLRSGVLIYKDTPEKLIKHVTEILNEPVTLEKACVYWMNAYG